MGSNQFFKISEVIQAGTIDLDMENILNKDEIIFKKNNIKYINR